MQSRQLGPLASPAWQQRSPNGKLSHFCTCGRLAPAPLVSTLQAPGISRRLPDPNRGIILFGGGKKFWVQWPQNAQQHV